MLPQNKKERKKVREVGILKKDPEQLKDQIDKLEVMSKLLHILQVIVLHLFINLCKSGVGHIMRSIKILKERKDHHVIFGDIEKT